MEDNSTAGTRDPILSVLVLRLVGGGGGAAAVFQQGLERNTTAGDLDIIVGELLWT